MATLYLSLGTNLGDRQKNLTSALQLIGREIGTVVSASDKIETDPWGFESTNRFLNMAIKVETTELMAVTPMLIAKDTSAAGLPRIRIL